MFCQAQRQGKKVESLLAEPKNQIGLSRLLLRGLKFVREQLFLAAGCAEYQANGAVSQPADRTWPGSHCLTETIRELAASGPEGQQITPIRKFLDTRGDHIPTRQSGLVPPGRRTCDRAIRCERLPRTGLHCYRPQRLKL